ncbi:MAG: hypothetical protein KA383_11250 [Phycisphaerae bacterium]|nr:hypothetical protein [Phycisphaerae bacterium]
MLGLVATMLVMAAGVPAVGDELSLNIGTDGALRATGGNAPTPQVIVRGYDTESLDVTVQFLGLDLATELTDLGEVIRVSCPDTPLAGADGAPALPVVRKLFGVRPGARIDVTVDEGPTLFVDLAALGLRGVVAPVQGYPSLAPVSGQGTRLDAERYAADAFEPATPVNISRVGIARGLELHLLEVRPVRYNPAQGALAVCPQIDIALRFDGGEDLSHLATPLPGVAQTLLNPPPVQRDQPDRAKILLIITAQDFAGSAPLTQFINAKTTQGYTVSTYTAVSGTTNVTIKAYIQSLWHTANTPDYVLIVGDAISSADVAESETIPVWRGGGSKFNYTDVPYVCLDAGDDWMPDVPLGRFPVATVGELQAIVDKVLYVESGAFADPDYLKRAAFIAGVDPYADAETLHNYIILTYMLPNSITSNRVYALSYGADTQDVADAFNEGIFLGSYFGHATATGGWGSPVFGYGDIDNLTNAQLYPFLVNFSCSSAGIHYVGSLGCNEKWMTVANKGAASAYGTTRELEPYAWSTWGNLYKFLFQALYSDGTRELGPLCHAADLLFVTYYGTSDPVSRDFVEEFVIHGDPSMAVPAPPEPPLGNYLIVAASNYVNSAPLNQLIAAREADGFVVTTYAVPAGTSRDSIKAYIQSLWGTGNAPNYILIVGDTSGATSTATTIPHWVGGGSKAATTDLPYACMNGSGDWYPDIAIGRFPCTSVAQLQAMVDKTLFVEGGSYPNPNYVRRVAFLANPDTYNTAEPTAEWVISTYLEPRDYEPVRIYAAQGGNTAAVTAAVNTGCLFVTYMGHSGSSGWWDPAFNQSNVNALTNVGRYGLVFGWSCNTAHFDYDECFGETWVRGASKGAAAYISASNYIYWGSVEAWLPSAILEKAFFGSFFAKDIWRVGPAWNEALYQFLDEYGQPATPGGLPTQNADIIRNFFEEFVLLGDPALHLPQGDGFGVTATPATQSLCCPPATQASYVVSVAKLGNFAQGVSLSVSGVPAGATASFTNNGLLPPYNSTLTIGNLASAPPGSYTLQITGTGGGDQKSVSVTLTISNTVPGTVTLSTPPNGAVDVARQPTLTWQPAAQAATYDVQVATDVNFNAVVFSTTTSATTANVTVNLDSNQLYYWRVRAMNGCGNGTYCTPFSFTTLGQPDYFTELFASGSGSVDLDYYTLFLIPDGSGDFYHACIASATALPTNPAGGTTLTLSDDASALVTPQAVVKLYGNSYSSFYVNANGNITFGQGDGTWTESLTVHFTLPRISALFDDLNPATGGTVSWRALPDRVAVTWLNVPEVSTSNANTFQIEMFLNGEIHITWLALACNDAVVGLSRGTGMPSDYVESDLTAYGPCEPPGACCVGETCLIAYQTDCLASGGTFLGSGTDCEPNPCLTYDTSCLIISEVVRGTESGGCPRWVEITNTGTTEFPFFQGGLIVQSAGSSDVVVDVDLTGVVIPAGTSFVIVSNSNGVCTGAFPAVYGQAADLYTNFTFGLGDERFILTDTADGSHLIDIYGEFGVDGTGTPWEYTDGYAYRLPLYNAAQGGTFVPGEWFFGGVGSLSGENPTELLLTLTTPGTHAFDGPCHPILPGDLNCDGVVDFKDINPFILALTNPATWHAMYPGCNIANGDISGDGLFNFGDINPFVTLLSGGGF